MKLLILGGTIFLGRHIAEAAFARGHEITLFNRGRYNPELFPYAENLRGDRDGDLTALRDRTFDAVVDTSGYTSQHVSAVVDVLRDRIEHYTFISSISVYRSFPPGRTYDEETPVQTGQEGYGALKARAEDVLHATLPARSACLRPGLIVGPHDPTDRFTYWVRRLARGGRVLAPGRPERPVQFIDVRDLAAWCVRVAEERAVGAFNAVGPTPPVTMAELLETCRAVAGSAAEIVWVTDETLLAAGVQPWTELPLWIPDADEQHGGMLLADSRRARAAGLSCRATAETVAATLEWDRLTRDSGRAPAHGSTLTPEREAELLAILRPRGGE